MLYDSVMIEEGRDHHEPLECRRLMPREEPFAISAGERKDENTRKLEWEQPVQHFKPDISFIPFTTFTSSNIQLSIAFTFFLANRPFNQERG